VALAISQRCTEKRRGSQRNKVEEEVEERTSATINQRPASGYTEMHRETLRFAEKKNVGINY
jgi:hypothetical protein